MCGAASALREKERERAGVWSIRHLLVHRALPLSFSCFLRQPGLFYQQGFFAVRARGFSEFPARAAAALHLRRGPAGRLEKNLLSQVSLSFLPRADWLCWLSPTLLEPGRGGVARVGAGKQSGKRGLAGWGCQMR